MRTPPPDLHRDGHRHGPGHSHSHRQTQTQTQTQTEANRGRIAINNLLTSGTDDHVPPITSRPAPVPVHQGGLPPREPPQLPPNELPPPPTQHYHQYQCPEPSNTNIHASFPQHGPGAAAAQGFSSTGASRAPFPVSVPVASQTRDGPARTTRTRDHLEAQSTITGQVPPLGANLMVTAMQWEWEACRCLLVEANGIRVARREDNDMINGTKLLNVAGLTRGRRDGILKAEEKKVTVRYAPREFKGIWIPYRRALFLANREKIVNLVYPLFDNDISDWLNNAGLVFVDSNLFNKWQVKDEPGGPDAASQQIAKNKSREEEEEDDVVGAPGVKATPYMGQWTATTCAKELSSSPRYAHYDPGNPEESIRGSAATIVYDEPQRLPASLEGSPQNAMDQSPPMTNPQQTVAAHIQSPRVQNMEQSGPEQESVRFEWEPYQHIPKPSSSDMVRSGIDQASPKFYEKPRQQKQDFPSPEMTHSSHEQASMPFHAEQREQIQHFPSPEMLREDVRQPWGTNQQMQAFPSAETARLKLEHASPQLYGQQPQETQNFPSPKLARAGPGQPWEPSQRTQHVPSPELAQSSLHRASVPLYTEPRQQSRHLSSPEVVPERAGRSIPEVDERPFQQLQGPQPPEMARAETHEPSSVESGEPLQQAPAHVRRHYEVRSSFTAINTAPPPSLDAMTDSHSTLGHQSSTSPSNSCVPMDMNLGACEDKMPRSALPEQKRALLDYLMVYFHATFSNLRPRAPWVCSDTTTFGGDSSAQEFGSALTSPVKLPRDSPHVRRGDKDKDAVEKKSKNAPRSKSSPDDQEFACPFRKRNPRNFFKHCPPRGWKTVRRVKDHLSEDHYQPLTCSRCQRTFASEAARIKHLVAESQCHMLPSDTLQWIDPSQKECLRRRRRNQTNYSEDELWEYMYLMLFPDADPRSMPSPRVTSSEVDSAEAPNDEMGQYRRFLQCELPSRVRRQLQMMIEEAPNPSEVALRAEFSQIVRDVQLRLFEEYNASSQERLRSAGQQTSSSLNDIKQGSPASRRPLRPRVGSLTLLDGFDGLVWDFPEGCGTTPMQIDTDGRDREVTKGSY